MNIYELKKINKEYITFNNKTLALNNINFYIKEGEIVVILGPSGSGKSTLLNVLSGIDNPTNGEIYFKENRIDNMNSLELTNYRKDNLGFIFQSYNLISNLTVIE